HSHNEIAKSDRITRPVSSVYATSTRSPSSTSRGSDLLFRTDSFLDCQIRPDISGFKQSIAPQIPEWPHPGRSRGNVEISMNAFDLYVSFVPVEYDGKFQLVSASREIKLQ